MININFYVQVVRLLPNFMRKPKMIAWLWRNIKPISDLHAIFLLYGEKIKRKIQVTSQIISLEWLLNFLFNSAFEPITTNGSIDYSNGGIWIENNPLQVPQQYVWSDFDVQPPLYIYSENDNIPATYIYSWPDYWQQYHYVIWWPLSLPLNDLLVQSVVNEYNTVGKKYIIQTY